MLEACAQTETMERVVFTSSVTAVVWKEKRDLDTDVDERNWSDPEFCRKFKVLNISIMITKIKMPIYHSTMLIAPATCTELYSILLYISSTNNFFSMLNFSMPLNSK